MLAEPTQRVVIEPAPPIEAGLEVVVVVEEFHPNPDDWFIVSVLYNEAQHHYIISRLASKSRSAIDAHSRHWNPERATKVQSPKRSAPSTTGRGGAVPYPTVRMPDQGFHFQFRKLPTGRHSCPPNYP
jgi:hypothetical protein